jgi:thymidylate synthase ThyX
MIKAKIVQDSSLPTGERLITFNLRYGRIIHSELLRHRAASHSVKSSRAIPTKKYRKEAKTNPYIPVKFGTNQKGMQAGKQTSATASFGKKIWRMSANFACLAHSLMEKANIHKEVANRILEPYVWVEETLTIEHDALLEIAALRIHPDAQEDIRKVIEEMMYEVENSTPLILDENQWHVPYVIRQVNGNMVYKDNDGKNLTLDEAIICSAARCARSSYANHDNSTTTYQNDQGLANKLIGSTPMHLSPFEHQARPFLNVEEKYEYSSNFRHFFQQRKAIEKSLWQFQNQQTA